MIVCFQGVLSLRETFDCESMNCLAKNITGWIAHCACLCRWGSLLNVYVAHAMMMSRQRDDWFCCLPPALQEGMDLNWFECNVSTLLQPIFFPAWNSSPVLMTRSCTWVLRGWKVWTMTRLGATFGKKREYKTSTPFWCFFVLDAHQGHVQDLLLFRSRKRLSEGFF